jgi:hypothetical protein
MIIYKNHTLRIINLYNIFLEPRAFNLDGSIVILGIQYMNVICASILLNVKNGFIELDDTKPGLGIELSEKYLKDFDIEI